MNTASTARLLWDGSGFWGLMTWEAARAQGHTLEPISAAQIMAGGLAGASLLVVPGGWPSSKHQALGAAGAAAIDAFVSGGGAYLGFCGGAGVALDVPQGLGLAPLARDSGQGRVPALNGPIRVRMAEQGREHALWLGIGEPAVFHVWWPGQFGPLNGGGVRALAVYDGPAPGLCSSDLRLDCTDRASLAELEQEYGMTLDPSILSGRPCVLEAERGRGRVVLSYLHLDTLGDANGGRALANLLEDLSGQTPGEPSPPSRGKLIWPAARQARELWELGRDLGLWRERPLGPPFWPRGIRGLEMHNLAQMSAALDRHGLRKAGLDFVALEALLAPIWRNGPMVLAAQAARLDGREPVPDEAGLESIWFPAARRVGGDLAAALSGLEAGLFQALSM